MLGPDAQKSMLEMLNVPSCILKFLMEKGRLGAQAIFETHRPLQFVVAWQGVGYFLMSVKTIKISEPPFEYIQRHKGERTA